MSDGEHLHGVPEADVDAETATDAFRGRHLRERDAVELFILKRRGRADRRTQSADLAGLVVDLRRPKAGTPRRLHHARQSFSPLFPCALQSLEPAAPCRRHRAKRHRLEPGQRGLVEGNVLTCVKLRLSKQASPELPPPRINRLRRRMNLLRNFRGNARKHGLPSSHPFKGIGRDASSRAAPAVAVDHVERAGAAGSSGKRGDGRHVHGSETGRREIRHAPCLTRSLRTGDRQHVGVLQALEEGPFLRRARRAHVERLGGTDGGTGTATRARGSIDLHASALHRNGVNGTGLGTLRAR